ncbi:MAG: ubiquinone biosynthesis regulatory protein kinase UbiB [Pseudomonadales bacterium]|nr:ubiquinone biosynthesis regulatory protein kinase UbiB [Pseudomonadales bacterium]
MSHLPRLIRVIGIIAKYRLDDFLVDQPGGSFLRAALLPARLPWLFSSKGKGSRNQRLRLAMEELGPIYIKFGQLLSTRRDFLDQELADELQSLQDNVPPFEKPGVEEIIAKSLGQPASDIFQELESRSFASASVAQVHKAKLMSGEEVVVKLLRPGIREVVTADLKLLKWIARLIEERTSLGKRLHPVEVVNDYEKVIIDELNLQSEGANASQLRRNFENSPELYVPKIYWDYTRRDVLVMERIHGIPVTDVAALVEAGVDLKKLAETGVEIFFTQVFEHNFFHADMHPGNIFVSRENPQNPQYIAIDCAIIGTLSDDDQEYLAKNLLAIFKRDYRKVAELHVECGWVPAGTRIGEFESAMRSVCEPIFEKPLKDISFAHLLVQLFRTAGRFNMEVQPSLVLLQKTLLNIEGLGRQLYPELDLWQTALPYLESWNSKRLNPFTLINKIGEELPNWVDQLPHLPVMVLDAISQSRQLQRLNANLAELQQQQLERESRRHRRAVTGGILALLLAAASLFEPLNSWVSGTPVITAVLTITGVFLLSDLLSFKR